jgi:fermentation-respiration switch protein FrsA (DUF1100 family)
MDVMIRASKLAALACLVAIPVLLAAQGPTTTKLSIRGRPQSLHLYGKRGARPFIVTSGDGGWIHLAPHVAEVLSSRGYFVVGFDAKAYLSSFTSGDSTLEQGQVAGDYATLIDFAGSQGGSKPVLAGVSEGAGLSVLAASSDPVKAKVGGVVAMGLTEKNELAWHWKDSYIYLTHGVPREPLFSTSEIIGRVAPVPLAVINSTNDDFVPLIELQAIFARAKEPKRLWIVNASDHGFSDNLAGFDARLAEAIAWLSTASGR